MANIPNSRRYRTVHGRKRHGSASSVKVKQSSTPRNGEGQNSRELDVASWPFVIAGLALLIAFPLQVIGLIVLLLVVALITEES
jgi:hypothetical protein